MADDVLSLVQSASNGDAQAIESLLARYLPDLQGYIVRHVGALVRERESAADLAQSVCREVLERLRDGRLRFQGEAQFRRWLYRAALMKMLSRHRYWLAARRDAGAGRHAQASTGSEAPPAALAPEPGTPSQEAAFHEELARFELAFAALPEPHREAIVLHHLEGLSHEEIAARKGFSASYSRALLSRALARLARLGVEALG